MLYLLYVYMEVFMIELKKILPDNLTELYSIMYNSKEPEWTKLNAPYFNEFKF